MALVKEFEQLIAGKVILTDEDTVYTSKKGEFTRGGVNITVGTIKGALFSNVSRESIDSNLELLFKAQLKKIGEWGEEECFEHPYKSNDPKEEYNRKRHRCPECWQSLQEEVK